MKLYYHKTSGGAEYLTDRYMKAPNGEREGTFKSARFIVRIDGDIQKDAELSTPYVYEAAPDLLAALEELLKEFNQHVPEDCNCKGVMLAANKARAAIQKAKGN